LATALPLTDALFTSPFSFAENLPLGERQQAHDDALLSYLLEQEARMGERLKGQPADAGRQIPLDGSLFDIRRG
jgi:hypothetical protein